VDELVVEVEHFVVDVDCHGLVFDCYSNGKLIGWVSSD
jgi:hypothetical protein